MCIVRDVHFPYTHNLADLLTALEAAGEEIPASIWTVVPLTRFATVTRYPGMADPVTAEEHTEAVRLAEPVLAWAERRVQEI
ncbi:MAG: HEPN domain-containing protein [Thermomicrobiales bacterium]